MSEGPIVRPVLTRFRVRYAETDQMGVAHHSHYVQWLEVGRVDFMNALGLPYREVEARGLYLVVTGVGLKYRRPAFFDDELELSTWVSGVRSRMVRFSYAVEKVADRALIAEGSSEHIATDAERRAVPVPEYLRELLETKPV